MKFIEAYEQMKKGKTVKSFEDYGEGPVEFQYRITDNEFESRCPSMEEHNDWHLSTCNIRDLDATDWEVVG